MTAEVVVALHPRDAEVASDLPVVKTYNYVGKRATRHATGRTVTLEDALEGRL
jgi:hypothetical protein